MKQRLREWKALDTKVIVVASQGGRGDDWTAYIGAVKGQLHNEEWKDVLEHGSKLSQKVAEAIFPLWTKKFVWRD